MARKVFFSFHFKRDSHRVSQIRNFNVISNHFTEVPFLDKAEWESIERKGDSAIQTWIDNNMHGTSVVVVLFGYETYGRRWVQYEISKAHREKRGIVCIDMSGMKNLSSQIDPPGINPLSVVLDDYGNSLLNKYKTYNWLGNSGRLNVNRWIEEAALAVGR